MNQIKRTLNINENNMSDNTSWSTYVRERSIGKDEEVHQRPVGAEDCCVYEEEKSTSIGTNYQYHQTTHWYLGPII